jgi:hypothetical protein
LCDVYSAFSLSASGQDSVIQKERQRGALLWSRKERSNHTSLFTLIVKSLPSWKMPMDKIL